MHARLGVLPLAAALALLGATAVRAQEARSEPQAGDLVWSFAEEDPFFDQRVRLAMILLMDTQPWLEATPSGLWPTTQLLPARPEDREFVAMPGIEADAPVLLLAAGQDFASANVIGECRVWAAPPPVEGSGPTAQQRSEAGLALGAALREAMEALGADTGHCALTSDPSTAQLLVWGFGETAPANPLRATPTLLESADSPAGSQPGGSGGGPAVPSTGNAGFGRTSPTTSAADVLLLALLALALPLAARAATSRDGE